MQERKEFDVDEMIIDWATHLTPDHAYNLRIVRRTLKSFWQVAEEEKWTPDTVKAQLNDLLNGFIGDRVRLSEQTKEQIRQRWFSSAQKSLLQVEFRPATSAKLGSVRR